MEGKSGEAADIHYEECSKLFYTKVASNVYIEREEEKDEKGGKRKI